MSVLVIESVVKAYPAREPSLWEIVSGQEGRIPRQEALAGVSLRLDEPGSIGIVGSNGAGKSTLVKILAGILRPDSGEVRVFGQVPWQDRLSYVAGLGYLAGQRSQLLSDLPVADSFEYLRAIHGGEARAWRRRVNDLVERFRLGEHLSKPARALSLGSRVKANLIASVLHRPRVLFLDEPTIGVDWEVKEQVRAYLRDYQKQEDALILVCSHDFADIEDVCGHFMVLERGRIARFETTERLRALGLGPGLGLRQYLQSGAGAAL